MNAVTQTHRGTVKVALPMRTVSEANARSHWAAKHRRVRGQRNTTALALRAPLAFFRALLAVESPNGPTSAPRGRLVAANGMSESRQVAVTLVRVAPSNGLDDDNLRGALKAVRDGVADALEVDDRDARVAWAYEQRRGPWGVEIRVEGA